MLIAHSVFSGDLFYRKSTIGITNAATEANNDTYCLRKRIEKFPLHLRTVIGILKIFLIQYGSIHAQRHLVSANNRLHVMSQRHDITSTLWQQLQFALHKFGFQKTGLVDQTGVLQTPIRRRCNYLWHCLEKQVKTFYYIKSSSVLAVISSLIFNICLIISNQ